MTHPMTTPRTALEECLRLADRVKIERDLFPGMVGNPRATTVKYSREMSWDAAAEWLATLDAMAELCTHGKALSDALEYLDGWLPIKSIPKDGSRVELLSANGKTDYGYWYSMAVPSADVQDHLSTESGEGNYTHWRPIPAHGQEVDDEM